jgi:hypothetical protein
MKNLLALLLVLFLFSVHISAQNFATKGTIELGVA